MPNDQPTTLTDAMVALLAFSAGAADVFSFLELHQIFTSAMTGNTALLGLAIGQGHLIAGARSFAALIGFAAGCAIATGVFELGGAPDPVRRRRLLLTFEIFCLTVATLLWVFLPHPVFNANLYAQIALWAVAMGMQSVNARKINLPGINTVVFTTTLTMIIMGLTRAVLRVRDGERVKPRTTRQMVIMLIYAIGAAITAALGFAIPVLMTMPPLFAVAVALAVTFSSQVQNRNQS